MTADATRGGAPKFFLRTFGCQMNEYDSAKIADVLHAAYGALATASAEDADIVLFNTCSVREKAQEKVFHDLGRIKHLKQARPDLVIAVGGCVASQEGAAIVARAPYVDVVFGPQTLHRLPQLIERRRATSQPQVDITFAEIEKFDHLPPVRETGSAAFVSIMEGCSKYCSFCVVPYTRGEEVSRPLDDVLADVAELALRGVREVTLLGQNVNAWRGHLATGEAADFALLLEYVAALPGIERIRYTTSHPKEFTASLIAAHARLPQLAAHVHLPVQSGADRILAAMKRGYTVLEYKSIVRRLRQACPHIALTSDFIVGFPGETDADFAATLRLIDEIRFDESFSFLYSPRPGTPAAALTDDTPQAVKLARLAQLQSRIQAEAQRRSVALVGSQQRVLVEGAAKRSIGELAGRTSCNRVINFPGPLSLLGQYENVTVTAAAAHTLRGERVQEAA